MSAPPAFPLRRDPRPAVAQAARDYADAWSVYVQWQVDRKRLIRAGLDTGSIDGYFDQRVYQLGIQLGEALDALRAPSGVSATVDS